jgi:hypothetical protein
LTDFAVLVFTRESKWFTTVSSQAIKQGDGQIPLSLKIQSEEGLRTATKKRRFAVKRCLALATTQLLLNMPNHILQLIDDFTNLRHTNVAFLKVYLYLDAIFYLFYLIQFPLMSVFVRLLHTNYDDRAARRRSQNRRQRQFGEDCTSSTMTTRNNKRSSREMESFTAPHRAPLNNHNHAREL